MFNLPGQQGADVQIFTANSPQNGVGWSTWQKRPGVSMCYMLCIAGGSSGGDGFVGASNAAGGGSGAGSGGTAITIIPAIFLPDVLFVCVGYGGNTGGFSGKRSYISVQPDITTNNLILMANAGNVGNNGASSGAAAGGTGGAVSDVTNCPLSGSGLSFFVAGQSGAAGGTATTSGNGASITLPTTGTVTTGGSGGGAIDPASGGFGGDVNGVANAFPRLYGGDNQGIDGSNGISGFNQLFFNMGGSGGNGSFNNIDPGTVGGQGGAGGYGCGGGGGGASLTSSAAGKGGAGGNGIVIIISW